MLKSLVHIINKNGGPLDLALITIEGEEYTEVSLKQDH